VKNKYAAFVFIFCIYSFFAQTIYAQDDLLNKSDDELFGRQSGQRGGNNDEYLYKDDTPATSFSAPGFAIDASYAAGLGLFPGWSETPWYFGRPLKYDEEHKEWVSSDAYDFDTIVGASMTATLGLNIQPSRYLRVRQTITFAIPSTESHEIPISFKEFFVDLNLRDFMYLRGGKFELHWGHSPNYPFTDLITRIPIGYINESPGEAYIARADVPVGIGGLQFVLVARSGKGFIEYIKEPKIDELGYGLKFNLAIPFIDVDLGTFYHKKLPLRFFLSMNKTLFKKMEVYAEGMLSYNNIEDVKELGKMLFSYNLGFIDDFFRGKLKLNAEFYYNAEDADYALSDHIIKPEEKIKLLLLNGFNSAVNVSFNPGIFWNMTFFASGLYAFNINSAQIVTGIRIEPVRHLQIYVTLQSALGSRDDNTYYRITPDTANRPFVVTIAAIIKGIYNFNHYED
jgi:hypothetical protein